MRESGGECGNQRCSVDFVVVLVELAAARRVDLVVVSMRFGAALRVDAVGESRATDAGSPAPVPQHQLHAGVITEPRRREVQIGREKLPIRHRADHLRSIPHRLRHSSHRILDDAVGAELDDRADVLAVEVDVRGGLAVAALIESHMLVGGPGDAGRDAAEGVRTPKRDGVGRADWDMGTSLLACLRGGIGMDSSVPIPCRR